MPFHWAGASRLCSALAAFVGLLAIALGTRSVSAARSVSLSTIGDLPGRPTCRAGSTQRHARSCSPLPSGDVRRVLLSQRHAGTPSFRRWAPNASVCSPFEIGPCSASSTPSALARCCSVAGLGDRFGCYRMVLPWGPGVADARPGSAVRDSRSADVRRRRPRPGAWFRQSAADHRHGRCGFFTPRLRARASRSTAPCATWRCSVRQHAGHRALQLNGLAAPSWSKIGLGLKTRPTEKQMAALRTVASAVMGAAAHLWWAYYKVLKAREKSLRDGKANAVLNKLPVANRHRQEQRSRQQNRRDQKNEIHATHRRARRLATTAVIPRRAKLRVLWMRHSAS